MGCGWAGGGRRAGEHLERGSLHNEQVVVNGVVADVLEALAIQAADAQRVRRHGVPSQHSAQR